MSDELGLWTDPIKPRPIPITADLIASLLEGAVLEQITSEPADSETISARLGIGHQEARKAVRALYEAGKVEPSGESTQNSEYPKAIIWRAVRKS